MTIKIREGETYQDWAERACQFELEYALKEIKNGADVNLVMEAMSARLTKKILHPVLIAIKDSSESSMKESLEKSKKDYEENYIKKYSPKADHMIDADINNI